MHENVPKIQISWLYVSSVSSLTVSKVVLNPAEGPIGTVSKACAITDSIPLFYSGPHAKRMNIML